ncbi:flavin-containing monooxygenase 9 [Thozetella sp. PMI_491]|nr:flavin-containing monooxygenase 9 [Thozetella sp. PMI_491]
MEEISVAVVGAGPVGLAALKCLDEEGFNVTCFEVRDDLGGIWCYSTEKDTTTCLPDTLLNSSRFISHFTDFPFPDNSPIYPPAPQMHQYFRSYADHFNLRRHIKFNTKISSIIRNEETQKWELVTEADGAKTTQQFDKVVVSNGLVYKPTVPTFEGQEKFQGTILHGRDYKSPSSFENKNVVVVGIGNTSADVAVNLAGIASKVYLSHRRGALVMSRFRLGAPLELTANYHILRTINYLDYKIPRLSTWMLDSMTKGNMDKAWEIDPAWGLKPAPSMAATPPCINEHLVPCLAKGTITSVKALRRFVGPRSVELDDGTVLDDIDAVVLGTGYVADTAITPWLKMDMPAGYDGFPLPRLFLQVFPLQYADSIAILNHFEVTDCAWVVGELVGMAIAQLWRGNSPFPSLESMEASYARQQAREVARWQQDHSARPGAAPASEFYRFMHTSAGTGVPEALSWGRSGWGFWWKNREMSRLMGWGVYSPYMMRVLETGKRKKWDGAADALRKVNAEAKALDRTVHKFLIKDVQADAGKGDNAGP